eukprot:3405584-Rhodomonas_salina.1
MPARAGIAKHAFKPSSLFCSLEFSGAVVEINAAVAASGPGPAGRAAAGPVCMHGGSGFLPGSSSTTTSITSTPPFGQFQVCLLYPPVPPAAHWHAETAAAGVP